MSLDFGGAQLGDVRAGDAVAGSKTEQHTADIPPRLADILERMLDSQQRVELRMRSLETMYHDDRMADAIERERRQAQADQRRRDEQAILFDGLDGLRRQIAELSGRVPRGLAAWLAELGGDQAATARALMVLGAAALDLPGVEREAWRLLAQSPGPAAAAALASMAATRQPHGSHTAATRQPGPAEADATAGPLHAWRL